MPVVFQSFPLSPGERAGVRASVNSISPRLDRRHRLSGERNNIVDDDALPEDSCARSFGRDGALRRPRRVQRRNGNLSTRSKILFRPLNADGDAAARRPYLDSRTSTPAPAFAT